MSETPTGHETDMSDSCPSDLIRVVGQPVRAPGGLLTVEARDYEPHPDGTYTLAETQTYTIPPTYGGRQVQEFLDDILYDFLDDTPDPITGPED